MTQSKSQTSKRRIWQDGSWRMTVSLWGVVAQLTVSLLASPLLVNSVFSSALGALRAQHFSLLLLYANHYSCTGVAALQTALRLGPGHRVTTILCDSGMRHLSKFW